MRLRFVVPADVDAVTGGNVYDLAVAGALRRSGVGVELVRAEPAGLLAALKRPQKSPGPTLVDGLLACQHPEAVEAFPASVLVHMPLVWQTDLTPAKAAELEQLEARALRASDLVVATSGWTSRFLKQRYGRDDVVVAAPGVEPVESVDGSDPPLFVQVAALLPHKDQLAVVAALAQVRDLPWQARLVGAVDRDPEYASAVRRALIWHRLQHRVDVLGEMDRDAAWSGADLTLLPSRAEAFGMAVTESLARGVPVIVAGEGPAEALGTAPDGSRPGVVIAPGDVDALVVELRRWLGDAPHRDALRASALARRDTLEGWEVTARCLRSALSATR